MGTKREIENITTSTTFPITTTTEHKARSAPKSDERTKSPRAATSARQTMLRNITTR